MNNIYIFKIDDFTEEDAVLAKKLDKSDKVIFLPNQTGMISYTLFPIIGAWKVVPTFMQPIAAPMEDQAFVFLLGLQCANCNGNLYIVIRDNPLQSLDGCSFDTDRGTVVIHTAENLKDIIGTGVKKKKESKKTTVLEQPLDNRESDEPISESHEMMKDNGEGMQTVVNEKETGAFEKVSSDENTIDGIGISDDSEYEEASAAFIKKIAALQKETGLDLVGNVNALYECVKNDTEGVLADFEFQLQLRFVDSAVKPLNQLLEPHVNELKQLI